MDGSQGDRIFVILSSGTKILTLPLRYVVHESLKYIKTPFLF